MSVEVRCPCGQRVIAAEGQCGQVMECPACKAGVAVPVATGDQGTQTAAERQAAAMGELALAAGLAAVGFFFLWDTPIGKLLVGGGVITALSASRRL